MNDKIIRLIENDMQGRKTTEYVQSLLKISLISPIYKTN